MTPATLALITAVGPPDWATNKFPTSSAIVFKRFFRGRPAFDGCTMSDIRSNRGDTLPTDNSAVKRKYRLRSEETPNSKLQAPEKSQAPKLQITAPTVAGSFSDLGNRGLSEAWCLDFGAYLELGVWDLELLLSFELGIWSFYTSTTGFSSVPMPEMPMRTRS